MDFFASDPLNTWSMIGNRVLFMIPVILVQLGGMVLALVFMRARVGPALCVLIGLGVSLFISLVATIAHEFTMRPVYLGEKYFEDVHPIIIAIGILQSLVHAGALGLLIVGALAWRRRTTQ